MDDAVQIPKLAERARRINLKQVSVIAGLSPSHIRRLIRKNMFPKPRLVGLRKHSWGLGEIIDHVASQTTAEAA